jgi:hypothetical protein
LFLNATCQFSEYPKAELLSSYTVPVLGEMLVTFGEAVKVGEAGIGVLVKVGMAVAVNVGEAVRVEVGWIEVAVRVGMSAVGEAGGIKLGVFEARTGVVGVEVFVDVADIFVAVGFWVPVPVSVGEMAVKVGLAIASVGTRLGVAMGATGASGHPEALAGKPAGAPPGGMTY